MTDKRMKSYGERTGLSIKSVCEKLSFDCWVDGNNMMRYYPASVIFIMKTLKEIPISHTARVLSVGGTGALRHRLLDMGITPKTLITVRKVAPLGDPIELTLRGYSLTLRKEDAARIAVAEAGTAEVGT